MRHSCYLTLSVWLMKCKGHIRKQRKLREKNHRFIITKYSANSERISFLESVIFFRVHFHFNYYPAETFLESPVRNNERITKLKIRCGRLHDYVVVYYCVTIFVHDISWFVSLQRHSVILLACGLQLRILSQQLGSILPIRSY